MWTQQGLNLRPLPYEGIATDQLSYESFLETECSMYIYKLFALRLTFAECRIPIIGMATIHRQKPYSNAVSRKFRFRIGLSSEAFLTRFLLDFNKSNAKITTFSETTKTKQ